MTWVLYIVFGSITMPSLQQTAVYTTEATCKIAAKALLEQNVRAACLPKENK
jgi:hypothetical protein